MCYPARCVSVTRRQGRSKQCRLLEAGTVSGQPLPRGRRRALLVSGPGLCVSCNGFRLLFHFNFQVLTMVTTTTCNTAMWVRRSIEARRQLAWHCGQPGSVTAESCSARAVTSVTSSDLFVVLPANGDAIGGTKDSPVVCHP